ncbi:MAG: hypothetical protein JO021_09955 [Alphaproteobacteria bacterium]|nr:hypothetical protein [Alphaproteobacteria bacterium]
MADDIIIEGDALQTLRGFSDSELLALWWATTETVENEAVDVSAREAAFVELAALEMARRALLP